MDFYGLFWMDICDSLLPFFNCVGNCPKFRSSSNFSVSSNRFPSEERDELHHLLWHIHNNSLEWSFVRTSHTSPARIWENPAFHEIASWTQTAHRSWSCKKSVSKYWAQEKPSKSTQVSFLRHLPDLTWLPLSPWEMWNKDVFNIMSAWHSKSSLDQVFKGWIYQEFLALVGSKAGALGVTLTSVLYTSAYIYIWCWKIRTSYSTQNSQIKPAQIAITVWQYFEHQKVTKSVKNNL